MRAFIWIGASCCLIVAVLVAYVVSPIRPVDLFAPAPTLAQAGGRRLVLAVGGSLDDAAAGTAADAAAEVLRRRFETMGWRGATVRREGPRGLVAELPGVDDGTAAARICAPAGKLSFRFVPPSPSDGDTRLAEVDESGPPLPVEGWSVVTGRDVLDAEPGTDDRDGRPLLNFSFTEAGSQRFARATASHVGQVMAIVLDDKILSAPRILGPITGGAGQISGAFTVQQVRELAALIRAGEMPARLDIVSNVPVRPAS